MKPVGTACYRSIFTNPSQRGYSFDYQNSRKTISSHYLPKHGYDKAYNKENCAIAVERALFDIQYELKHGTDECGVDYHFIQHHTNHIRIFALEQRAAASTANDSSEVPESSLDRFQVLSTGLAEIGLIQEQENQQPELNDAISKETKCTNEVCFYRFVGQQGFGPVVKLKPSMRKVQEKGRELMEDKIFPLFSILCRELLTYFQLLFILFFVVKVSIIDIGLSSHEERNTVDLVSLGLFVFFLFLSIVDNWIIIFIYKCSLLCTPCRRQMSGVEEDTADNIECGRCSSLLKSKYSDVVRMMLNEVIVYTTLICTMFQLILNIKQGPFYGYRTIFFIVSLQESSLQLLVLLLKHYFYLTLYITTAPTISRANCNHKDRAPSSHSTRSESDNHCR